MICKKCNHKMVELFYSTVCDYCEQLKNKEPKYAWVFADYTVKTPDMIHLSPVLVFESKEKFAELVAPGIGYQTYKVLVNDKVVFTTNENIYSQMDVPIFHSFLLDDDDSIHLMDGARVLYVETETD